MTVREELHVVFGTGAIGLSIMDALIAQGKTVRLVNRSGQADVPKNVEVMAGDASHVEFTKQVSQGATAIYNALNPPYDKWEELFPPLQASLIEAAETSGAVLVSLENTYMYGKLNGKPLTENRPYNAHTHKGHVRAQMAEEVIAAHNCGRIRAVIGRASDYFGPRATVASMIGDRAVLPALEGKAAELLFQPDKPHTYSYVPDIGRALVLLAEQESAYGQVWHLPNPQTVTTRELLNMVFAEAGQTPKISVMPRLMFNIVKRFNPILREMDEMMYEFDEQFCVEDGKFRTAFGHLLQPTPLDVAVKETVDWFRANPKPN